MSTVYIERRELTKGVSLSWDVAHHLYARQLGGAVVVVEGRPEVLLASVRKQWMKILKRLERERASLLGARRVQELERQIERMRTLAFTARPRAKNPSPNVCFLNRDHIGDSTSCYDTVYLTCGVDSIEDAIKRIKRHGLLVTYEQTIATS